MSPGRPGRKSGDFGRAVSRVLSAPLRAERIICLSSQYPKPARLAAGRGAGNSSVSYLALHPMGFSVPPRLLLERWALTPPFHPYPTPCGARRSNFLWHCPSKGLPAPLPRVSPAPRPGLRGIAPCGVRTFLPRLAPEAILHPSKIGVSVTESTGLARSLWPAEAINPPPRYPCRGCNRGCGRN